MIRIFRLKHKKRKEKLIIMNENVLTKVLRYICAAITTTALFVNCGSLVRAGGEGSDMESAKTEFVPTVKLSQEEGENIIEKDSVGTGNVNFESRYAHQEMMGYANSMLCPQIYIPDRPAQPTPQVHIHE